MRTERLDQTAAGLIGDDHDLQGNRALSRLLIR